MTATLALETIGRRTRATLERLGNAAGYVWDVTQSARDVGTWLPQAGIQARRLGVDSMGIGIFIAVFTGVVLALLASYSFTNAVPHYFVGTLVEKTITMELAPVLTGLALAGRVGANIAAEIGTMRVTEQIDALETLGYDPYAIALIASILGAPGRREPPAAARHGTFP